MILHFQDLMSKKKKKKHLFEIKIFCNLIHVFNITFDQFNESLLKKKNEFPDKISTFF